MKELASGKRIAKNTIYLYFRMMFTMIVSLYTSRVVLDVLGICDYGIYQTIGGVVAMLSFINNSLSMGSSRFLTYELGRGNFDKLKKTFSTILSVHVLLAIIVLILAETIGLWFIYNKLELPVNRLDAAVTAYHFSVITVFIAIVQVPFNSTIISHERMSIYAYMSIIEALAKLLVCYLISAGSWDRLIIYSALLFLVQFFITLFYRVYCSKNFKEANYKLSWDKSIIKGVLSYSGWNLFSNTSIALITQGTTIIINIFFSPSIVAARAIANQVNAAANQFIGNFRTAVDPQIVKRYAAGDFDGSKRILLESTKFSFYMMLILALPICLVAEELLNIWLKEVPDYTVVFLRYAVITSLFQVLDSSLYTALYAKGTIRQNAIMSPTIMFFSFPIIYILYTIGYGPEVCAIVILVAYAIIACLIKPFLLVRIVGYQINEIILMFINCAKVLIVSLPIPILIYVYSDILFTSTWIKFFSLVFVSIFVVAIVVWFIGLRKETRHSLIKVVNGYIKRVK